MASNQTGQGHGPLLTVGEVASALRVSNMTIYRLIRSGDITAFRVGKNYRIRQSDLDHYLDAGLVAVDEQNG
jgi:excisionase family DNA binding protein